MKWLIRITGGYTSSAKVSDGALVLSLPDAKTPVVWRMDLADIKAAAFEIEESNGDYVLLMKTTKGQTQNIAPFDSKGLALEALMATSEALERSSYPQHKGDKSMDPINPGQKKSRQLTAGAVGIVILLGLIFTLTQMGAKIPAPSAGSAANYASESGQEVNGGYVPGVPVSADDFLRGR